MTAWHERCRRHFLMQWCLNLIELCAGQWSVMFGPAANDIFQWGTQIFPGCFLMSVTSVQKFLFVFLVEWNKVFPTCRPAIAAPHWRQCWLSLQRRMWLGRCIFVLLLLVTVSSYTVFVLMTKSKDQSNWRKISWDIWINFLAQNTQRIQVLSLLCFYVKLSLIHFIQVQFWKRKLIGIFWWPTKYVLNFLVKRTQLFGTPCTVCIPFILNRYPVASLCPRSRPPPPPWRCVRPGREWRSSLVSVLSRKLE